MSNKQVGHPKPVQSHTGGETTSRLPLYVLLMDLGDARLSAVSANLQERLGLPTGSGLEQLSLPDLLPRDQQPEVLECLQNLREGWVPEATQQDFQWQFRQADNNQPGEPLLLDCAFRPLSTAITGQSSGLALVMLRQSGGTRQSPTVETAGAISKAFQSLDLLGDDQVGSYKLDTRGAPNFSVISRTSHYQLEIRSITPGLHSGQRSLHAEMLLFHDFVQNQARGANLWNRHYLLLPGLMEKDARVLRERVTTFIKTENGKSMELGSSPAQPGLPQTATSAQSPNLLDGQIQAIQDFPYFSIRVETNPFPLLEHALRHDRAEFLYQPIVDLATGKTERFEALLRLRDERNQLISPAQFIPPAENHPRLIRLLDRHVCRSAFALLQRKPQIRLNINISGPSWVDPSFSNFVLDALDKASLDVADRLGLEITETALIDDIPEACGNIAQLQQQGILIFLDDFGSSYSSAAYLRDLPVDVVKLDGSFTESFPQNSRSQQIAHCLLEAAARCGCQTVVEHISSPELLELVRQLNAQFGQGFHLGSLLPEEELPES